MARIRLGLIFGGRSAEHEVSLRSARSVKQAIDPEKFEVTLIGITKDGKWIAGPDPLAALALSVIAALEVVFPLLHGPYGEDGTVQGLLELADLPYVGSGVLASALAMDKAMCKQVLRPRGIPVTAWLLFTRAAIEADAHTLA